MLGVSSSQVRRERRIPTNAARALAWQSCRADSTACPSVPLSVALLLLLLFAARAPAEKAKDLRPLGYVNDFADVLSAQAREELTALCQEVDHKAQAQMAIVTIHALEGVPVEDFSMDLATRWGIGPKQKDRGVLILLAVDDHRYRVEIGYGLEGILPDGKVGGFGREMVPLLRRQDYGSAVLLLTERIARVIAQERGVTLTSSGTEAPRIESPPSPHFDWVGPLIAVIFLVVVLLWRVGLGPRGRRHYPWMRGPRIDGGWGGASRGGPPWSGGGGFGGFGGGSFGGGGASGSW